MSDMGIHLGKNYYWKSWALHHSSTLKKQHSVSILSVRKIRIHSYRKSNFWTKIKKFQGSKIYKIFHINTRSVKLRYTELTQNPPLTRHHMSTRPPLIPCILPPLILEYFSRASCNHLASILTRSNTNLGEKKASWWVEERLKASEGLVWTKCHGPEHYFCDVARSSYSDGCNLATWLKPTNRGKGQNTSSHLRRRVSGLSVCQGTFQVCLHI